MIRVCGYCSNVDIDALKQLLVMKMLKLDASVNGQEFVAYINDELIETSTEEELLDYIKRVC